MLHVEELVDVLLQGSALRCVFTGHLVGFFQLVLYDRCILVYLELVPALLQEISAVVIASVGVAEGNILDIVAHHSLPAW